jgi:hypothetical protein
MPTSELKPWPCLDCKIMMELIDEDHCKCPICKTEVWFKYDAPDLSDDSIDYSDVPTNYVSRSLPELYKVPPGGSKSGKRPKKKGTKTYLDNGYCG